MSTTQAAPAVAVTLNLESLSGLIQSLKQRGYEVWGPAVRDGAITYGLIQDAADLPRGWTAEQSPGCYRLKKRDDGALFGYAVPAFGLKRFFHPPEVRLFRAERNNGDFTVLEDREETPKRAFLGVRACDLAAVARQDKVLMQDRYADPIYQSRREASFLVAVSCTEPAGTCFCASMGAGPEPKAGFDILLTEIVEPDRHEFLAEAGSPQGEEVLKELGAAKPSAELAKKGRAAKAAAAGKISKALDTSGLKEALYEAFDSPYWDQIAARCLACANCTMVCPTCFCVTVEDSSDVSLHRAERWRRWDSCFTQSFSYIHGGSVRLSPKSRYRQWLTHKLATWVDQFGETGCVGCGRCITWCPAGIDIAEEAAALRGSTPGAAAPAGK